MTQPVPLSLEIRDETERVSRAGLEWLAMNVPRAVHKLNAAGELRVAIVDDAAMSVAHEQYAGVSGTTDVLTFDMSEPEEWDPGDGRIPRVWVAEHELKSGFERCTFVLDTDIMVCLDEGSRQAEHRGYAVERELLLYIVHGVLHCLGYDDDDDESFREMHAMEDAVLSAIGIGPTFGSR